MTRLKRPLGYSILYLVVVFIATCLFGAKGLDLYQSLVYANLTLLLVTVIFYLLKLSLYLIN